MEDDRILTLKHSIKWFKGEALKLDETLENQKRDIQKQKSRINEMKEDEKFLKDSLKESMHKKKLIKIATTKTQQQNDSLAAFFNKNMPDFDRDAKLRQIERKKFEALSSEQLDVDIDS